MKFEHGISPFRTRGHELGLSSWCERTCESKKTADRAISSRVAGNDGRRLHLDQAAARDRRSRLERQEGAFRWCRVASPPKSEFVLSVAKAHWKQIEKFESLLSTICLEGNNLRVIIPKFGQPLTASSTRNSFNVWVG
jgi:hypothetical protein